MRGRRHRNRFQIPSQSQSKPKKPRLFTDTTVLLAPAEKQLLTEWSDKLGIPQSRLLAIALDNELDQETPFHYPCTLPTTDYIPGAYMSEATKILRFLEYFRDGTGRDMLMLSRRSIGIPNRADLMLGFRELLMEKMVEERDPLPVTGMKFEFFDGYKVAVIASAEDKRQAKIRAKEEEILRLQVQVKKMKGE